MFLASQARRVWRSHERGNPVAQSASCKCKPRQQRTIFDGIVIWVYQANEFNRGARPRADNEARNSRRVKDAVLSDLMGLPVDRTESVSASRSMSQWRAVCASWPWTAPRNARDRGLWGVLSLFDTEAMSYRGKGRNIFIRMFNSANVPRWIPSTVHSITKFQAWCLTRRTQFKNCP